MLTIEQLIETIVSVIVISIIGIWIGIKYMYPSATNRTSPTLRSNGETHSSQRLVKGAQKNKTIFRRIFGNKKELNKYESNNNINHK